MFLRGDSGCRASDDGLGNPVPPRDALIGTERGLKSTASAAGPVEFDRFDLLARVVEGHSRARFDLSSSDMPPQRLSDSGGLPDRSLAESHVSGCDELRSELAKLYGGRAEDYIVTAGASEANFAVCAALLRPGDPVLVERPVYQPLESIPRALSGNVSILTRREANGFRLSLDELQESAPERFRLLVVSNLNNPTGAALEPADVQGLSDLAAARDAYVLVDETFRDLAFDHETPTIGGRDEGTVVTSTMSKFYGAGGLRIGWIRAAASLRERARRVLDYLSVTPAAPSEAISLGLLKTRSATVARNRRLIEEGRRVAAEWSEGTDLEWREPVGHLAFPRLGGDTARLAEILLRDYETFIAPGECFGLGGHFRLNIGIPADVLSEGLARVTRARRDL